MRLKKCFLVFQVSCVFLACRDQPKKSEPVLRPDKITQDMMTWLYYNRDQMRWSADFKALDTNSHLMGKGDFLYILTTGKYLPVKIKTADSSLSYQLYKLNNIVDKEIIEQIKTKAQIAYQYHQLEGQKLPSFNFIDLNGHVYNPATTKGKVVVLNCWFINCQRCVEEMPDLNKIVQQTKKRNDIIFIGLAFDKADDLKTFLSKRRFDYAIVPEKKDYLVNVLGIVYYPTHLIVDREGRIAKIIDGSFNEFIDALNKEINQ